MSPCRGAPPPFHYTTSKEGRLGEPQLRVREVHREERREEEQWEEEKREEERRKERQKEERRDGEQERSREVRERWRGACKLAIHALHEEPQPQQPQPGDATFTTGAPLGEGARARRVSACKLTVHAEEEVRVRRVSACKLTAHAEEVEVHPPGGPPEFTLEVTPPEEEGRGVGLRKVSSCKLTMHAEEERFPEEEVSPGDVLCMALKKQQEVSKSRRLSDCLLHQVLITNMVHKAEEKVNEGIRAAFCFPF